MYTLIGEHVDLPVKYQCYVGMGAVRFKKQHEFTIKIFKLTAKKNALAAGDLVKRDAIAEEVTATGPDADQTDTLKALQKVRRSQ